MIARLQTNKNFTRQNKSYAKHCNRYCNQSEKCVFSGKEDVSAYMRVGWWGHKWLNIQQQQQSAESPIDKAAGSPAYSILFNWDVKYMINTEIQISITEII